MNAAGNKRTPKDFPIEKYLHEIENNMGKDITINIIVNGKSVREVVGKIDYSTNKFFGVRIYKGNDSFVETFMFSEVFTGHVIYELKAEIEAEAEPEV